MLIIEGNLNKINLGAANIFYKIKIKTEKIEIKKAKI